MKNLGYYNGKIGLIEELTVPFLDRVHFFGDGVYDFTMIRNYKYFALDEHLDRLYRSASMLEINVTQTKEELKAILFDLVTKVDSPDQSLYIQATRGTADRTHSFPDGMPANLWIMLRPMKIKDVYKTISAVTIPDTRFYHCNIKTLNLIPSVMYAKKAERLGIYETILYREGGRVTECAHSNVSIITNDGKFKTAPLDNLILPGIARAHLIKGCRELGIPVDETPFYLDELKDAAEIIISSSSAPCLVCENLDGQPVGGKAPEIIDKLRKWVLNDFEHETD